MKELIAFQLLYLIIALVAPIRAKHLLWIGCFLFGIAMSLYLMHWELTAASFGWPSFIGLAFVKRKHEISQSK